VKLSRQDDAIAPLYTTLPSPSLLRHVRHVPSDKTLLPNLTSHPLVPRSLTSVLGTISSFRAPSSHVFLPSWMFHSLGLRPGEVLLVSLFPSKHFVPRCLHVTLRPHASSFLSISDAAAVLEANLQHYSTLTSGTVVSLNYRGATYKFDVLEIKGDGSSARAAHRACLAAAAGGGRDGGEGGKGDLVKDALAAVEAGGVAGKIKGEDRDGEAVRWGRVQDCDVAFDLLKARDKLEDEAAEKKTDDEANASNNKT
jgi:hypothetical protein